MKTEEEIRNAMKNFDIASIIFAKEKNIKDEMYTRGSANALKWVLEDSENADR